MEIKVNTDKTSARLTVSGGLTIEHVAGFKESILGLKDQTAVTVDFADVTAIDVSGIQLLCSANISFEKNGRRLSKAGPTSDLITEALVESGYEKSGTCPENPCNKCFWKGDGS